MKLKNVPLDKIIIGKRFRKDYGDIEGLATSIRERGIIQPVAVKEDGTSFRLLAGGRRIAAARNIGLRHIPVVIIDGVRDELDAREVELFENVFRKDLSWLEKINLTDRIHKLMLKKYGGQWSARSTAKLLSMSVGKVSEDRQLIQAIKMVPDIAKEETRDKARRKFKSLIETAVVDQALDELKAGKEISEHIRWADDHYKIGDALKGMAKMHPGIVHFAEVDPPYGIDLKGLRDKRGTDSIGLENYNEIPTGDYPGFIAGATKAVFRVLADNSFCIWWYGSRWHEVVKTSLKEAGFTLDNIPGIWYKINSSGVTHNPDLYLGRVYEPFFICWKGNPLLRNRGTPNVFPYQVVDGKNRIHPTERPVELIEDLLDTFVYPGARVMSPFLGSGNTLRACYRKGLVGFGWELASDIKPLFISRIEAEFGK